MLKEMVSNCKKAGVISPTIFHELLDTSALFATMSCALLLPHHRSDRFRGNLGWVVVLMRCMMTDQIDFVVIWVG